MTSMASAYLPLAIMAGLAIGSFLNLCADRLPLGQSIVRPRSHCDHCGTTLQSFDLIPVLSFFVLRGRCRYCQKAIPPDLLIVEIVTGTVFGLIWYQASTIAQAGVWALHASLLILVGTIDLKHQLILNKVTYPWFVAAVGLAATQSEPGLWNAALGSAIGLGLFGAIYALSAGGMGFGDVKLAGVLGLILGFPQVFVALGLSAVLGGVVAATLLALGRKSRKDPLPYGVFLSLGGIVALLWGNALWSAYQRFL